MKSKKTLPHVLLGITGIAASLIVATSVGYQIADKWRSTVDGVFGTQSYVIDTDENAARFKSDYATADEMMAAARALSVKEGEEGTVIMKNDNSALPIASGKKIALFGVAAWKPFMQSAGDLKAGNSDAVNLDSAFTKAGFTLDQTLKSIYDEIVEDTTVTSRFGNTTTTYNKGYLTSPGDMTNYMIRDVVPSKFTEEGYGSAAANWKEKIDKTNTIGVVVFARGAGESNTYAPKSKKSALNTAGEETGKDALRLSDEELQIVDAAKETCSKVIVLLNSGNTMEIDDIAKGGAHEVDAIGYMGVINDYQCEGIVNVLTGKANATGALPDTYLKNNEAAPAVVNFGGDVFSDASIAENSEGGTADPRYPDTYIANGTASSFSGGGTRVKNYSGNNYMVEAEGIYVGYKYFETRYFDTVANSSFKANSTKGSTDGAAWDYNKEVVYPFGHGLSYIEYEQELKSVKVDKTIDGEVTATVTVKNKGDKKGKFLTQLYVNLPYTEYDRTNGVEKSAVNFLNSAKVELEAGESKDVEIKIPTKYLASYDSKKAKTYILDDGDYYFTVANGSHEAVNNILGAMGKTTADGMDANATGSAKKWSLSNFDETTYATDHGVKITNVADDVDVNYWWGEGTAKYLSRSNWEDTYPVNYNDASRSLKIADSIKKDELIKRIQGRDYEVKTNGAEAVNVDGKDNGYRFKSEQIGADQLNNIEDPYWEKLVEQIPVNESVGAVVHGGSQSDTLTNIENPIVKQNEGVNGIKGTDVENENYHYNVNSQTLLGSSFNPELAYEWGLIEGNGGLHMQKYQVWGTGLTLRRTPYNGRNYEYISEDPMLTNRIGYGILKGCAEKGIINGPKHMGFNDQEHNRSGIMAFMNEQKFRETDLRGFQGGLEDGGGLAVMIAFNRVGPTNASHHTGMLQTILRKEWGFTGVVSTDLASAPYFDGASCVMASITQIADFGANNSYMSKTNDHSEGDGNWSYLSVDSVKNDPEFVAQARQDLKYQFFTFANSAVMNITTRQVTPAWESLLKGCTIASSIITGLAGAAYVTLAFLNRKKGE